MSTIFKKTVLATVFAGIFSTSAHAGFGPGNQPTVPSGWTLKENYGNILVYQKNGEQTYIQIVDIRGGAKFRFIHPGKQYGNWGSYPKFSIYSIDNLWNYATNTKTMVNGQFFAYKNWSNPFVQINPTFLSFGVKSAGSVLTFGEDKNAYPATSMKQLEVIDNVGVTILPWSESRLQGGSTAQNILVGLDPRPLVVSNKDPNNTIGRMMVCSKPASGAPWLFILSAQSLTQQTALSYSTTWGCTVNTTIMMDGSGSAQLKTATSGTLLSGDRDLPQAIAIYNQ